MAADVSAGGTGPQRSTPPWTGPWADDARRLLQLVQTAAEQAGASAQAGSSRPGSAEPGSSSASESSSGHSGGHPPECQYCPFCQGVALLRRAGPDVLDQVAEFAAGLAATLRATQPAPAEPSSEPSEAQSTGATDSPAEDTNSARVQPPSTVRIDVTD
jgi:hypothetical protein